MERGQEGRDKWRGGRKAEISGEEEGRQREVERRKEGRDKWRGGRKAERSGEEEHLKYGTQGTFMKMRRK